MKETLRVLTKKKGCGHRETKVTIDWSNVSQDALVKLSRIAILHILQSNWRASTSGIPDECSVVAKDMIHAEVFVPREYRIVKRPSLMDTLLETLTPEERAILLQELHE